MRAKNMYKYHLSCKKMQWGSRVPEQRERESLPILKKKKNDGKEKPKTNKKGYL